MKRFLILYEEKVGEKGQLYWQFNSYFGSFIIHNYVHVQYMQVSTKHPKTVLD